jgi:hypothetical protein
MSATSRIVRRLRLRGPTEAAIQRAIPLVEDALRTASLPGDGGRVVLVRRMAIGRIDSRTTSQSASVDVGRAWERLAPACAHGTGGDLASAPAVWFRDALEAHSSLALRVLAGATADAWYWRLAVPPWRPYLSVSDALRRIMLSLGSLPEAPAALPQWTSSLADAGHAERLVAALRAEDVAALARAAGLRMASFGGESRTGGERESTAASSPAAADDAAHDMRHGMGSVRIGAGAAARDPRRELLRALLRAAGSSAFDGMSGARTAGRLGETDTASADRRSGTGVELASPESARRMPLETSAHAADRAARSRAQRGADDRLPAELMSTAKDLAGAADALGAGRDQDSIAASLRVSAAETGIASARESGSETIHGRPGAASDVDTAYPYVVPGAETRAGGLLFLLPVLERMGYSAWLDAQPAWARVDVAGRLFALVLARLGIDASDPAWQAGGRLGASTGHADPASRPPDSAADSAAPFGARRKREVRAPRRFVAPAVWREELCERDRPPILVEYPNFTTLWDASGRLLLGTWRGPRPRELLGAQHEASSQGQAPEDSRRSRLQPDQIESAKLESARLDPAELVTTAWLVAARRWLRRHAGIGIATLVRRPAQLALTPTHVDLVFELASVEIRIRRAGLDIDPGWVRWFGRVVTFHYRDAGGSEPT